jgi:hypothetical protein
MMNEFCHVQATILAVIESSISSGNTRIMLQHADTKSAVMVKMFIMQPHFGPASRWPVWTGKQCEINMKT